MGDVTATIERLRRRGVLSITASHHGYTVGLDLRTGPTSIDFADVLASCRLGPHRAQSTGNNLAELLEECEQASRPRHADVDDLVWEIERRRDTRTAGPPLPTYRRWHGWRPGHDRWLRTSSHAYEYLVGYTSDLETEREFNAEQARRSRMVKA